MNDASRSNAGTTAAPGDGTAVEPFQIDVPDAVLEDLQRRLDATRWPDELPESGWEYGVPLGLMRALVARWRSGYDWRSVERQLNSYPQSVTTIDGARIHCLHVRSSHPEALPLLLMHGWPGSVAEFLKIIGPLTDPTAHGGEAADAFHLVIPALPGFGFSGPTKAKGWDAARAARAFAELMARLGYDRYGAQGGDMGALIGPELTHADPEHLIGAHLNAATVGFIPWGEDSDDELATFTPSERKRREAVANFMSAGNAYFQVQAGRPQMIGYALTDSPVGQLAWAVDRMAAWVHGSIEEALTHDEILTNVMFYWVTKTATSAARMYYENMHAQPAWGRPPSPVPVGVAVFAEDVAIRRYGEQAHNIVHWSEFETGGHFAAMEAPELLTEDIRAFFRSLR